MQRLIFENSPLLIIVCLALGITYAWILYSPKSAWSKQTNRMLFALRFTLVTLLSLLLLGPIFKVTTNFFEKPTVVFLTDNSASLAETLTDTERKQWQDDLAQTTATLADAGYDINVRGLDNEPITTLTWKNTSSDLQGSIQQVVRDYESKNLAAIILTSDGIYNSGASPLYQPTRIPIYTIGVGDTAQRLDVALKNLNYNKIAYQGNKFQLTTEVAVQGIASGAITVSVSKGGKIISTQTKSLSGRLLNFNFALDAEEKGVQRFDVTVQPLAEETNKRNNYASAFIEVVEGKKKILLIAPAPHPDIKALRAVVEKNANYEFILHIPGQVEVSLEQLQPDKADLIIFYDVVDLENKTKVLLDKLSRSRSSLLYIIGSKSNLRQLAANGVPVTFENPSQWDAVTPAVNASFRNFNFLEGTGGVFQRYPPADVPFGKFTFPPQAAVLLHQRIGSIITDRPLFFTWEDGDQKKAMMIGHNFWRWRLHEYAAKQSTDLFDDVFSKAIQYLGTLDDKRKFKCFALQNEFAEGTPAIIESQVYNDLFELVYGNTVSLRLTNETGKETRYSYITSPGNTQYRIGGLAEGVYRFTTSTALAGKTEEVKGQFVVKALNIELQNLTADHGLLKKLSAKTGGRFFSTAPWDSVVNIFRTKDATSIIHSYDSYHPLITLKLVFVLLLLLATGEWFLRKYSGGY